MLKCDGMEYDDFEQYLEFEYTHLGGEYYECMGGHVWHLSGIETHWECETRTSSKLKIIKGAIEL